MAQKIEMKFGEWMIRLISKMIALGAVILGIEGMWIVLQDDLGELLMHGAYGKAACVGILCIAANFGIVPLALEIDQQILNTLGHKTTAKSGKDGVEKQEGR
ncbi:hypothetical protein A8H39_02005 [Paraburkholderia fungorum]|uniref:hypothetical protein n=1 Tax=Paraburkholderia fungorum TaxID=134537 RepID=UPI0005A5E35A|nr:hypothetical protein [Paraburkholderia fungorum]MBB5546577.1 hypothetical protein [Paraburkholderia fungorum]PNE59945.1 hypothetical protein A8H39_02005 [Paraburkholderia fungorum]